MATKTLFFRVLGGRVVLLQTPQRVLIVSSAPNGGPVSPYRSRNRLKVGCFRKIRAYRFFLTAPKTVL
jgi:hypothetical protein